MAFGRLTTKFRIFRTNLSYSTNKNSKICMVGAKLHNYCINYDLKHNNAKINAAFLIEELVDGPEGNNGYLPTRETYHKSNIDTSRRDSILSQCIEMELERPTYNIARNIGNI